MSSSGVVFWVNAFLASGSLGHILIIPFERSRLRGGRFAWDTPDVMHHDRATILIQFARSYLLLYNKLEFHRS